MEMKAMVAIEIVKNENKYYFYMPVGAPYGEAYDSAFQVLNKISEMGKAAAEAVKPAEEVVPEVIND